MQICWRSTVVRLATTFPNQMPRITEAMLDRRLRVMLLLGTEHAVVVRRCERSRCRSREAGSRRLLRPLHERHGATAMPT